MILVQRGPNSIIRDSTFLIRRTRPGLIFGDESPGALGPLAVVDHAEIGSGTVIAMHEHRDDEILSYVGRGALVHEDSAGHRVVLSSARLMMMSAGAGLLHQETVPDAAVEMLQIFIRPHASSLPGLVAFHDRTDAPRPATWNLLAGPDDTDAPLTIRNKVSILDCHLQAGDTVELLPDQAITRWCYVFAGSLNIGHSTLHKGDSFVPVGTSPLVVRSIEPAIVLIFSIGRDASVVCTGTISGRD